MFYKMLQTIRLSAELAEDKVNAISFSAGVSEWKEEQFWSELGTFYQKACPENAPSFRAWAIVVALQFGVMLHTSMILLK